MRAPNLGDEPLGVGRRRVPLERRRVVPARVNVERALHAHRLKGLKGKAARFKPGAPFHRFDGLAPCGVTARPGVKARNDEPLHAETLGWTAAGIMDAEWKCQPATASGALQVAALIGIRSRRLRTGLTDASPCACRGHGAPFLLEGRPSPGTFARPEGCPVATADALATHCARVRVSSHLHEVSRLPRECRA